MNRLLQRPFDVAVPLATAWGHLARVEEWPLWAAHIERITLEPPDDLGPDSPRTIRLRNGIRSTFRMRVFRPGRNGSSEGRFLWLDLCYDHRFDALAPGRTRLAWTIDAGGFAARVLGRLLAAIDARNPDRAIPQLVRAMGAAITGG